MSYDKNGLITKIDREHAALKFNYDSLNQLTEFDRCSDLQSFSYRAQSYSYLGTENRILLAKNFDGQVFAYIDGNGIDQHLGELSHSGLSYYTTEHLG